MGDLGLSNTSVILDTRLKIDLVAHSNVFAMEAYTTASVEEPVTGNRSSTVVAL